MKRTYQTLELIPKKKKKKKYAKSTAVSRRARATNGLHSSTVYPLTASPGKKEQS